jgi:6-phosphogluconolactonase (cycloisomerase 2 family)
MQPVTICPEIPAGPRFRRSAALAAFEAVVLALFVFGSITASAAQAAKPTFAYAINSFHSSISSFTVDEDGRPRPTGYVKTEKFPSAVAAHPSGKYVLVASQSTSQISVYFTDSSSGRLTAIPNLTTNSGVMSPFDIVFHPTKDYVYIAGRMSAAVSAFAFDVSSGKLTPVPGSPFKAGNRPRQLAITPNGRYLYAVNVYSHDVSGYRIDPESGALKKMSGSPFPTSDAPIVLLYSLMDTDVELGAAPHNISIHPSGKYAYVANWMSSSLSAYRIDDKTGELSLMQDSPFMTEPHPYDVIVDPGGRFLYTANWQVNKLTAFAIDQSKGRLEKIESIPLSEIGYGPTKLWFTPSGDQLYVSNYNSHNIEQYVKDANTGKLTLKGSYPVVAGPRDMDFVSGKKPVQYQSKYIYALNAFEKKLVSLALDESTGDLRPAHTVAIDADPVALDVDSINGIVYVAANNPDRLYAFKSDISSGKFEALEYTPIDLPESPTDVSVDLNGYYIYLSSGKDNRMSIYYYLTDENAVKEWPESPRSTGENATLVATEPLGRFTLVTNNDEQTITPYRYMQSMGPATTDNTPGDKPARTGKQPSAIAFDPTGNYAYVANALSDNVSVYWMHRQNGGLEELDASPFKTDKRPMDIDIHPSGTLAFVVSWTDESVRTYTVDPMQGALTETGHKIETNPHPIRLLIDASGRWAYLFYKDSKVITHYAIDAATGKLKKIADLELDATFSDAVIDQYIR